ncbi:MAG: EAL domain-containing protein [Microcoleaceae cyanobacterium MO_207.B10]|nr:EAL domain-containing protein [Microcoleaceae cyanobacterium MO_207.B10]
MSKKIYIIILTISLITSYQLTYLARTLFRQKSPQLNTIIFQKASFGSSNNVNLIKSIPETSATNSVEAKSSDIVQLAQQNLNKTTITVAIPKSFPPQYAVDENGKPVGFAIDVMEKIAARAGFKLIYQIEDNWKDVHQKLESGVVDLVPNMGVTKKRKEKFAFTRTVETFSVSIFVRQYNYQIQKIEDLNKHQVGVVKTNVAIDLLEKQPGVIIKVFNTPTPALLELLAGEIDAFIYPEPVVWQLARKTRLDKRIKVVGKPLIEIKRAIAVRKENIQLLARLNQAVESFVGSQEYQEIYIKWYGKPTPFWTNTRIFWSMSGLLLLTVSLMAVWRYYSLLPFSRLQRVQAEISQLNTQLEKVQQPTEKLTTINHKLQQKIQEKVKQSQKIRSALLSKKQYQRLIENLSAIIYQFSDKRGGIYYSFHVTSVLGYSPDYLYEHPWLWQNSIHPEDIAKIQEVIQKFALGENFEVEYRIQDAQKNWHWFFDRSISRQLEDDEIIIEGLAIDITERKQIEKELREAKELYQTIFNQTLEGFWIVDVQDKSGHILEVNHAYCQMIGYTREELLQMTIADLEYEETPEVVNQNRQQIIDKGSGYFETRHRCKDGSIINIEVSVNYISSKNYFVSFMRDITERKKFEEELKASEERFRKAIINAPFPIIIHAEGGEIVQINQAWTEITGYTQAEIPTMYDWINKAYKNSREIILSGIKKLYEIDTKLNEGEFTIQTASGEERIWNFSSAPLGKLPDARKMAISIAMDITEQKQAEQQLVYDALHDALTGLYNRNFFKEQVEESIKYSQQNPDYLFAVLFIDLDRFQVINDSLGHVIGDQLLIAIARRLEESIRRTDTLARLGGDEFTILLENLTSLGEAVVIAQIINQALQLPFYIEEKEIFISCSIGIALNSVKYHKWSDILRDADLAMYRAKQQGRDCYAIFDPLMYTQISRFLELETNLRLALERQEFLVYYQPIINLTTNKLAGFEALIRWQNPSQGLVSPGEFIPVAEETGLIVPLGEWILRESCQQMQEWQAKYPQAKNLKISVNLSGKQLKQKNIIKVINQVIESTGIKPENLKLEITESMLMENQDKIAEILTEIRQRKIKISLDDFGTGYSSLSYLHRFPINTLKVDQSFVRRIGASGENLEIVQAIVTLAHTLKMDVIAEGLEKDFHVTQINSLNCEFGQGYFFSKPLPSEAAEKWIVSTIDN